MHTILIYREFREQEDLYQLRLLSGHHDFGKELLIWITGLWQYIFVTKEDFIFLLIFLLLFLFSSSSSSYFSYSSSYCIIIGWVDGYANYLVIMYIESMLTHN